MTTCHGCNQFRKLTRYGCCNACLKRVNETLQVMEDAERAEDHPATESEYRQAEQRYLSMVEEFGGHLLEMRRLKQKWLRMELGWTLYEEHAVRIVAGAQADLELLRKGKAEIERRQLRRAA